MRPTEDVRRMRRFWNLSMSLVHQERKVRQFSNNSSIVTPLTTFNMSRFVGAYPTPSVNFFRKLPTVSGRTLGGVCAGWTSERSWLPSQWLVSCDWWVVIGELWLVRRDWWVVIGELWLVGCDWWVVIGGLWLVSLSKYLRQISFFNKLQRRWRIYLSHPKGNCRHKSFYFVVSGGVLFLIICCCLVRCCRCVKDCVDVVCCCCKCNCKGQFRVTASYKL